MQKMLDRGYSMRLDSSVTLFDITTLESGGLFSSEMQR
jgi:hypothetical protein